MKLKRRTIAIVVCVLLLCGMFLFFFYTAFGLSLQPYLAEPVQRVYLRFYVARIAATGITPWAAQRRHFSASGLYGLAINDLSAAQDIVSDALARRPNPDDLQSHVEDLELRGYIELHWLSYSNAAADFQESLKLIFGKTDNIPLSPMDWKLMSMARDCAEARRKYIDEWQVSPERRPLSSDSAQPTNRDAQTTGLEPHN